MVVQIMIEPFQQIIYWSEADQSFIAEVPELPDCMSDGSTYEEALKNVQVITDEWIETAQLKKRPIPIPRGKLMYA